MRMPIDGKIRPRLTRSRSEHRRIKPHVEEMPMCEKDAMPAGLNNSLVIRAVHGKVTVAEDAHDALSRQLFQCICIGGIVSCMKPHLCLCCLGIPQHRFQALNIPVTVTDNSNIHALPRDPKNDWTKASYDDISRSAYYSMMRPLIYRQGAHAAFPSSDRAPLLDD